MFINIVYSSIQTFVEEALLKESFSRNGFWIGLNDRQSELQWVWDFAPGEKGTVLLK